MSRGPTNYLVQNQNTNNNIGNGANKSGKTLGDGYDHFPVDLDVKNIIYQEENIYYNVNFLNTTDDYIPARYSEQRSTPIVQKPSDYKLSVVRLNIDIRGIGLLRPSLYDWTLTLYYFPDRIRVIIPLMVNYPLEDYIYSFDEFLNNPSGVGMNQALKQGFEEMVKEYDIIHGAGTWEANPLLTQQAPQVIYDPGTSLFSFITTSNNFDVDPTTGIINNNVLQLYLNNNLQRLFGDAYEFYSFDNGYGNYIGGYDDSKLYRVAWLVHPYGSNIITFPGDLIPGSSYIQNEQNYQTVAEWFTGRKLLLTSSTLGNRDEYVGSTFINGRNIFYPILTDFGINFDTTTSSISTPVVYNPLGEYRIIDLLRDQPLSNLDFQFYIQDDLGNVIPILLFPGTSFSFKLLFTKSIAH